VTDAAGLFHIQDLWQEILRDAMPDERRARVHVVGTDGDVIKATVTLRTGRVSIGFAVPTESAGDPTTVVVLFNRAVADAGYAGNINVRVPPVSQLEESPALTDDQRQQIAATLGLPPLHIAASGTVTGTMFGVAYPLPIANGAVATAIFEIGDTDVSSTPDPAVNPPVAKRTPKK